MLNKGDGELSIVDGNARSHEARAEDKRQEGRSRYDDMEVVVDEVKSDLDKGDGRRWWFERTGARPPGMRAA